MRPLAFAAIFAFGAPSILAGQTAPPDVVAAVRQAAADWGSYCSKGDITGFGSLYAPDVLDIDADGTVMHDRAAVERVVREGLAGPMKGAVCALTVRTIKMIRPDVVATEGTYTLAVPDQPPLQAMYLAILAKQSGRWLYQALMGAVPAK